MYSNQIQRATATTGGMPFHLFFDVLIAHRAPIPEEEPIPGEDPVPEEEPAPHPDPVVEPPPV